MELRRPLVSIGLCAVFLVCASTPPARAALPTTQAFVDVFIDDSLDGPQQQLLSGALTALKGLDRGAYGRLYWAVSRQTNGGHQWRLKVKNAVLAAKTAGQSADQLARTLLALAPRPAPPKPPAQAASDLPAGVDPAVWQAVKAKYEKLIEHAVDQASGREYIAKVLTAIKAAGDKAKDGSYAAFLARLDSAGVAGVRAIMAQAPAKPAAAAAALLRAAAQPKTADNPLGGGMTLGAGNELAGGGSTGGPGAAPTVGETATTGPTGPGGGDPANQLTALMKKEGNFEQAIQDVRDRIMLFLYRDASDGVGPFVTDEEKADEGDKQRNGGLVLDWVRQRPGLAAKVYQYLGHSSLPVPAWAAADPKTLALVEGVGREAELVAALKRWSVPGGSDRYHELGEDDRIKPGNEEPVIGPLTGGAGAPEWLAAFLKDASDATTKILYHKDPVTLRKETDERDNRPEVPGGPRRRGGLAGGSLRSFGMDQLFGKWGDDNVVLLDGRLLSIKLYTEKADDGTFHNKVGIFDISNPSDVYGKQFDLTWNSDKPFVLDDRTPGHKQYVLTLAPSGDDTKITLARPDGTEGKNASGNGSPSVNDLFRMRAQQAIDLGDVTTIGGKDYYVVPQASAQGGLLFMPASIETDITDRAKVRDLMPELVGYVNQRSNGRNENIGDKSPLGKVGDKFYWLVYDRGASSWLIKEGPEPPPKPAPAPGATGSTSGGGGSGPSGPSGPTDGGGGAGTFDSEGWVLFPPYKRDDPTAAALNAKIASDIPARIYRNPDAATADELYVIVYKWDKDPKVGPVPIYRHTDKENIGKLKVDVLGGDVLSAADDIGVFYANLRKGPISAKLDDGRPGVDWDILGSFDPSADRNNISKIKDSKETAVNGVLPMLDDAMKRGGFAPAERKKVVDQAGKILQEKKITKADCGEDVPLKDPIHYAFDGTTKGERLLAMGIIQPDGPVTLNLFPKCSAGEAPAATDGDQKLDGRGNTALDNSAPIPFDGFPASIDVGEGADKAQAEIIKDDKQPNLTSPGAALYRLIKGSETDEERIYWLTYRVTFSEEPEASKYVRPGKAALLFRKPPKAGQPGLGPPDWKTVQIQGIEVKGKQINNLQPAFVERYIQAEGADKVSYSKGAVAVYDGGKVANGKFDHCLGVVLVWGGVTLQDAFADCNK